MVTIHGKQYVTVAERVTSLHEDLKAEKIKSVSIVTEKISDSPIVFKATVTIDGNVYTGTSAANTDKPIEKQSPYEVAETSAVGRALGFAGYGSVESIASADEIVKAQQSVQVPSNVDSTYTYEEEQNLQHLQDIFNETDSVEKSVGHGGKCEVCGELKTNWKEGVSKAGKPYAFYACKTWHK